MPSEDYNKAYKLGKKEYQARLMRGEQPTLEVLDDILPPRGSYSEASLGLVQIPLRQIAGTCTAGRSISFAANFMPILKEGSEFSAKWSSLCKSQEDEGIRDPIKAYEYMNKFYVLEGNKRVSVMKYFDAVSIAGNVTRIIPKRTEQKENKIYYEFLEFYELSRINYIWFSRLGSFEKLQAAVGKAPGEAWTADEQINFNSSFSRFQAEFEALGGEKLSITAGDAFLAFLEIYGYEECASKTVAELKTLITASWEEFELISQPNEVDLKLSPAEEKKPLLNILLPHSKKLQIAFLYAKTPTSSAWTYAHELGRLHLEQAFPDEVSTMYYENVTPDNVESRIGEAIAAGANLIFTTSPSFVQASVKAAIAHPDIRILNCSLNTSHRYIRTYYSRMHEAKFLMGAIAGALAEHDCLAYVADYPIRGTIANINAFALGAKMINPRVQVHLEWRSLKDCDIIADIMDIKPDCISGRDMIIPEDGSRAFGLFSVSGSNICNLATPFYHWGKFYERLIRTIMNGQWKQDDSKGSVKAINYWWGMSADVIDIFCSKRLPIGTKRLVDLLKHSIRQGNFNPFTGILYSQDGIIQNDPHYTLTPEEVASMDWLAENIIGSIPDIGNMADGAKPVISQQGIGAKK